MNKKIASLGLIFTMLFSINAIIGHAIEIDDADMFVGIWIVEDSLESGGIRIYKFYSNGTLHIYDTGNFMDGILNY